VQKGVVLERIFPRAKSIGCWAAVYRKWAGLTAGRQGF